MARRRARALLRAGASLCAVASKRAPNAERFAADFGVSSAFDDYRRVLDTHPAAVLIEVPHDVQDEIAQWAALQGLHVFIGGPLSISSEKGLILRELADARRLVIEAGYEARYKMAWEEARRVIRSGELGRIVGIRSIALWGGGGGTWYERESATGGMPLAHMTYAFVNPLRWLFGEVEAVAAFANQIGISDPGFVREQTCTANLLFEGNVVASLFASYVQPAVQGSWAVSIIGTEAAIELLPTEMDNGGLCVVRGSESRMIDCSRAPDAFERQAEVFLQSISGKRLCRNTPEDTLGDVLVAEAISRSARERKTIVFRRT